ncbi:MAG TPA: sugar phosphate isomerase/epimerase [Ohtaekwangia sp.]|nr:sugar phosphate isomerase/epimerase [Ohtaekwangia sp.]
MKAVHHYFFALALIISCTGETLSQEIGLQMGSMRELLRKDVPAALARIKELGITELEGGVARGMDRETFKTLLKENGLRIVAVGSSFERLQQRDSLQKIIDNAKDLGAQYVVCYWIPHDGDNFTYADMQKAVAVFNTAGKTLRENGLTFCYHPHGYEFREYEGGKGTLFDYMMENTEPEYVSYQMDVFWIRNPGQDPVALLKKYAPRWKMLHLKDRKIGTPDNPNGRQDKESNVVLGTGDVGIAAIMKTAKKIGIRHYLIEDESSRALEQVPQSIAYLKSLE